MAPGGPDRTGGQIGRAGLSAGGGGSGTAGSGDFTDQAEAPTANGTAAERRDRAGDRRCRGAGGIGHERQDHRGGDTGAEGQFVIGPTGAVRVMVATKPVDFRKGAEGLAALVRETMGADPFSGAVYVFRAKRADRIKLVFWDGTGVVLVAKRLEDGQFRWPKAEDSVMHLTAAQLSALLEGLDWRRVHEVQASRVPSSSG